MDVKYKKLAEKYDYLAPDGSEIRLLISSSLASLDHLIVKPKTVSRAGYHKSVQEKWYIIRGEGKIWLKKYNQEQIIKLEPGFLFRLILMSIFSFVI